MKNSIIKILNLISAFVLCLFVVGYTFAWFSYNRSENVQFGASSSGAYFAGGSGTKDNPFTINRCQHLYNLAWLQNMGKFVDSNGEQAKYYFALSSDIEMTLNGSPIILPPIGNDEYPFLGHFDGNGYTISQLIISTNRNILSSVPAALDSTASTVDLSLNNKYKFSNSVGFFGMTGEGSDIKNFILKNPVIDAADNLEYNSVCQDSEEPSSSSSPKACGIAIGYVNGSASTIGVVGGALAVRRAEYTTVNSIIGSANPDTVFDLTGGVSGGDGNNYGSSFNVSGMLDRLYSIYRNQYGTDYVQNGTTTVASTYSPHLPALTTKNSYPTLAAGEKMAFSVNASLSTYSGTTASEVVADTNVGYFLGNQNKITNKTLTFGDKLNEEYGQYYSQKTVNSSNQTVYVTPDSSGIVPSWFYENTYESPWGNKYNTSNKSYTSSGGFSAISQEKYDSLPQNMKELIPSGNSSKTFTAIRLSQQWNYTSYGHNYGTTDNYCWSYHGQISYMGETYGSDATDSNGNVISNPAYTGGIALPNNGIWFKPATAGVFRFVMYADTPGQGFALLKINRTNATDENPFNVDSSKNGADCLTERIIYHEMPSNVLLYFEYDATDDMAASKEVEYLLLSSGSGAYFIYLDIGASGMSGETGGGNGGDADSDDGDVKAAVKGVDFVGEDVTLERDEDGAYNFSSLYTVSGTMIAFSDTNAAITLYFHRIDEDDKTIAVRYYTDTSSAGGGTTGGTGGTGGTTNGAGGTSGNGGTSGSIGGTTSGAGSTTGSGATTIPTASVPSKADISATTIDLIVDKTGVTSPTIIW